MTVVTPHGPAVHGPLIGTSRIGGRGDLYPEERALITNAYPKRVAEFRAGRVLARRLLAKLEAPQGPLLSGPDRAPLWPVGFCGSLSHCDDICVAAVARRSQVEAVGIDVEPYRPLEEPLWDVICRPEEIHNHQRIHSDYRGPGLGARFAFSAKEAVYKALNRYTERELEFHDVSIQVDGDFFRVVDETAGLDSGLVERLVCRWTLVEERWLVTTVILPVSKTPGRVAVRWSTADSSDLRPASRPAP